MWSGQQRLVACVEGRLVAGRLTLCFDGWTLDLERGALMHGDRTVDLRPKSFDVLRYLAQNPGRLATKDEIIRAVWANIVVTDESLAQCISDVRQALCDQTQRIIKTVPRRGYRFDAALTTASAPKVRTVADPPTILVLPFTSAGDETDGYFGDGLTDDLITSLSNFTDLNVIARGTAFASRGKRFDARRLGLDLGARYRVEGSVRHDGERVRVTAQLVQADTGLQLWAQRYDRTGNAIFAIQDDLVQRIVGSIVGRLTMTEVNRSLHKPPGSLVAYDYFLQGHAVASQLLWGERAQRIPEARRLLKLSIAADPAYARPRVRLASLDLWTWLEPVEQGPLRAEYAQASTLARACSWAQKAAELDPCSAEAHAQLASALHWNWRPDDACAEFVRAFELNPNLVFHPYMMVLAHYGRAPEAIEYMKRIKSVDPFIHPICDALGGFAYFQMEAYEDAFALLRGVARQLPEFKGGHLWFAAVAAQLGKHAEAQAAAAQVMRLTPDFTITQELAIRMPNVGRRDADRFARTLRKAGLPE